MSGWRALLSVAGACAGIGLAFLRTPAADAPPGDLERALGILEYLIGDYSEAVSEDGRLLDPFELEEQVTLLGEVGTVLGSQPGAEHEALQRDLGALVRAARDRRPPSEVVPRLRDLHTRIAGEFGVQLTPRIVPSLPVGRLVYESACSACHGEDGSAAPATALELVPPPRNFLAPEPAERLSPYTVFAAVTWGIQGTPMPSFESLDEDERWSVAFYVLALRQDPARAAPVAPAAGAPELTLGDLAFATDRDLLRRAEPLPEADRRRQLRWWRLVLPLAISG